MSKTIKITVLVKLMLGYIEAAINMIYPSSLNIAFTGFFVLYMSFKNN